MRAVPSGGGSRRLADRIAAVAAVEDLLDALNVYAVAGDAPTLSRALAGCSCPGVGVPEDPATGSAAAGLGMVLVASGLLPEGGRYEISQGVEMGRPSALSGRVEADGGVATRATSPAGCSRSPSGEIAVRLTFAELGANARYGPAESARTHARTVQSRRARGPRRAFAADPTGVKPAVAPTVAGASAGQASGRDPADHAGAGPPVGGRGQVRGVQPSRAPAPPWSPATPRPPGVRRPRGRPRSATGRRVLAAHHDLDPVAVGDVGERLLGTRRRPGRAHRRPTRATRLRCDRRSRTQHDAGPARELGDEGAVPGAVTLDEPGSRPWACQRRDPDNGAVRTLLLMAVGVVAVSLSGPLMAAMVVPPLAIAFWRNGLRDRGARPRGSRPQRREELCRAAGPAAGPGGRERCGARAALRHLGDLADADVGGVRDGDRLPADRLGGRLAAAARRAVRRRGARRAGARACRGAGGLRRRLLCRPEALLGDLLALVGGVAAAAYMLIGRGPVRRRPRRRTPSSATAPARRCWRWRAWSRGRTWGLPAVRSGGCCCWSPRPRS